MKRLDILKSQRAKKIEDMEKILNNVELEKRSKSDEEATQWDSLNSEVENLDKEIKIAERQEELNKSIVSERVANQEEKEQVKMAKRYDLSKAILEFSNKNLTGVEKEMHEIGVRHLSNVNYAPKGLIIPETLWSTRATETKTTGATHIPELVQAMDVIAPPSLLKKLGVTEFEGLKSKLKLNFSSGHQAAFVGEGGTAAESIPTNGNDELSARRVQGWKPYSNEYLAESAVMGEMLSDMLGSIDRAVTSAILAEAVAASPLTGYGTGDVKVTMTYQDILKLFAALETENFFNPAFAISKALYHELEGTAKDSGSGRFVIESKALNGEKSLGTSLLPVHDTDKYDIVFGDWKRAYAGYYSGMELIIDPYTLSDDGETKITFVRLADIAVNPSAFASIRNAGIS